jgi:Fe-S-cluster containining protein
MHLLDKFGRQLQYTEIDEDIAGSVINAVIDAAAVTGVEPILEMTGNALAGAEQLVERFEAAQALPRPVVCREGCAFCCFNQVELTPLEAILIGHHVSDNFPEPEKAALRERIAASLALKSGKSKCQLAAMRQELPCPLLRAGRCAVYPVRPLVCRAMHSLDRATCTLDFLSHKAVSVEYYLHRYELMLSVTAGLKDGCRALGRQDDFLDLTRALADFFGQESPIERWLQGEKVFSSLA